MKRVFWLRQQRFLTCVIWLGTLMFAVDPTWLYGDGKLNKAYSLQGKYAVVADGVGMKNSTEGLIPLTIPGAVHKAFLYWAGFDVTSGGDDQLTLQVDDGPKQAIHAEQIYGPDLWWEDVPTFHLVYRADVTSVVQSGSHSYRISDFAPIRYRYGVGLVVIHEDPAGPNKSIDVYDGLDAAYALYPAPRGPNTEVTSANLVAASFVRNLRFTLLAAGVRELRPNAIWLQSGAGPEPTTLINAPGAVAITQPNWPLGDKDGAEWDTYTGDYNLAIGHNRFSLQIESKNDLGDLLGASLLWLGLVTELSEVEVPVELSSYQAGWLPDGVRLQWTTQSETNNLGFFLFRSENEHGPFQPLNAALIDGSGNSPVEHHYSYLDQGAEKNKTYYYKLADVDYNGLQTLHGPIMVGPSVITDFALQQNYPNPFNPQTTIHFCLDKPGLVELSIYNLQGQRIRSLLSQELGVGVHQVIWDGRDDFSSVVSNGVYLYSMRLDGREQVRKMQLLK